MILHRKIINGSNEKISDLLYKKLVKIDSPINPFAMFIKGHADVINSFSLKDLPLLKAMIRFRVTGCKLLISKNNEPLIIAKDWKALPMEKKIILVDELLGLKRNKELNDNLLDIFRNKLTFMELKALVNKEPAPSTAPLSPAPPSAMNTSALLRQLGEVHEFKIKNGNDYEAVILEEKKVEAFLGIKHLYELDWPGTKEKMYKQTIMLPYIFGLKFNEQIFLLEKLIAKDPQLADALGLLCIEAAASLNEAFIDRKELNDKSFWTGNPIEKTKGKEVASGKNIIFPRDKISDIKDKKFAHWWIKTGWRATPVDNRVEDSFVVFGAKVPDPEYDYTKPLDNIFTLDKKKGGHKIIVYSANFSPDGKFIVTASQDYAVKIMDVEKKEVVFTIDIDNDVYSHPVQSANFSPDGKSIVTTSQDNTIEIIDIEKEKVVLTLDKRHMDSIFRANFSPDGKFIVTSSVDKTVRIIDIEKKKVIFTLDETNGGHTDEVLSANFSPDGRSIVTASRDNTVKIIDVETKEVIFTLDKDNDGHSNNVYSANFSPDGKFIVTASQDHTVKIIDVEKKEVIFTLNKTNGGHTSGVKSANFSPDGKFIATASNDNTVKIIDIEKKEVIFTLDENNGGHTSRVNSANFSPDGKFIVTASDDNTVKLFEFAKKLSP